MSDYISREAAIEAAIQARIDGAWVEDAIEAIPAAFTEAQIGAIPALSSLELKGDDAWKRLFCLIALLLSDKEKFDTIADEILNSMEKAAK